MSDVAETRHGPVHRGARRGGPRDRRGALRRRDRRPQGRLPDRVGRPAERRRAGRVRGGPAARGRGGQPRPEPLLRRGAPRAAARVRRPGDAPVGDQGLRDRAGPGLRDRRDRLRHPVRRREGPAVAPRLPVAAGDVRAGPAHLARLQRHDGRHDRGHGALQHLARHPVRERARVRPPAVPGPRGVAALRGGQRLQDAAARRRLGPLRPHDPPRHREPLRAGPPRRRPRASTRPAPATTRCTT